MNDEAYLRGRVSRENLWYFHTTGRYCHHAQTWVVLDPTKCEECDRDDIEVKCWKYGGKHDE